MNECRICEKKQWKVKGKDLDYTQFLQDTEFSM